MLNKSFYRAFEDRHRGSRSLVKGRLEIYLPFILKLKDLYPNISALDIGCGRGEWLELLKDNGFFAQGVDLDCNMLEACDDLGLNIMQGNGIELLTEKKDDSIIIISAFHVVEHISFDDLQLLVKESLRVLKPGGILILETPNPENIKVATEKFYLDPTHIKPIPFDLLSFLLEFAGYTRTKVLRLQEAKELAEQNVISLMQVLEGVSPDYAVVAQKGANKDILGHFDNVFSQEYGLSLALLADKFEQRLFSVETKANEAEAKANEAEAKANEAEAKANEAEAKANEAEAKANEAEAKANEAEAKANEAEAKANEAEAKVSEAEAKVSEAEAEKIMLNQILSSYSWKLTEPLRFMTKTPIRLLNALLSNTFLQLTLRKKSKPNYNNEIIVTSDKDLKLEALSFREKNIYLRLLNAGKKE